jgi:hypothetical protein
LERLFGFAPSVVGYPIAITQDIAAILLKGSSVPLRHDN